MTDVIVDTNVIVVANGQNSVVVEDCVSACSTFLTNVVAHDVVLMDKGDDILIEYLRAIKRERPHQLGARFLFHVLVHKENTKYVRLVNLEKNADQFIDFPTDPQLNGFDLADWKFAALARKTGVAVTNATDSDWANFRAPLKANAIEVNFLCGCDPNTWFTG
jgi:hypothetical protein